MFGCAGGGGTAKAVGQKKFVTFEIRTEECCQVAELVRVFLSHAAEGKSTLYKFGTGAKILEKSHRMTRHGRLRDCSSGAWPRWSLVGSLQKRTQREIQKKKAYDKSRNL